MFPYLLNFYTTWNVIFVCLHTWLHSYINLLYSSFIALFIGLYISNVNPRQYVVKVGKKTYTITGTKKIMVDLFFHILPFAFVYYIYRNYYKDNERLNQTLLTSIVIFIIYICSIDIEAIYGIPFTEFTILFAMANISYFLLV
jgi:magnesium-transporting ATPase (P-type)